ncbi:hypothetical protein [Synechocystis sp. PCC 6714]|nr:hypothetical protein [Synechocystis sp. PCC 6714]AIE75765.1 hypothetical protein D082_32370 [Synechocystis sp. PCC 6714]
MFLGPGFDGPISAEDFATVKSGLEQLLTKKAIAKAHVRKQT